MRPSPTKTLLTLKSRSDSTAPPTPPPPLPPCAPPTSSAPLHVLQRTKLSSRNRPQKRTRVGDAGVDGPSGSGGSDEDNLFGEVPAAVCSTQLAASADVAVPSGTTTTGCQPSSTAEAVPPALVVVEWDTNTTLSRTSGNHHRPAMSSSTPAPLPAAHPPKEQVQQHPSLPAPQLDKDQLLCVTHDVGGPLLIKAGAGSGKTQTIAKRIAYLLECGVLPFHILGLSFSRASAEELRDRVAAVLPDPFKAEARKLKLKTIHGFCFEMVRKYRDGGDKLTVFDDKKRRVVARQAVAAVSGANNGGGGVGLSRKDAEAVSALLQFVDATKRKIPANGAKTWPMSPYNPKHQQFLAYENILHQQEQACDFADLQWYMYQLVIDPTPRGGPLDGRTVVEELQRRFTHIVVDEAQDVDEVQYEILCRVAGDACRVSCVGDPRQAIYGFRGAIANFFNKWSQRFGLNHEAQRMLNRNYRSVSQVVAASNAVSCEPDANCVSTKGPGAHPVSIVYVSNRLAMEERVLAFVKHACSTPRPGGGGAAASYRDIGILARKGATGRDCQAYLQAHGIPCRTLRRRDPSAAVMMRSFLAHLRCVVDPHAAHVDVIEALEYPTKCERSFLTMLRTERKRRQDLILHDAAHGGAAVPPSPVTGGCTYFSILEELVDNQFMVPDKRLVPRTKKQRAQLDAFVHTVRHAHAALHNDAIDPVAPPPPPEWLPQQEDAVPGDAMPLFGLIRKLIVDFGFALEETSVEAPAAPTAALPGAARDLPETTVDDDGDEVDPLVDGPDSMRDVIFEALENLRATGEPHRGPTGMCALIDSMLSADSTSDYGPMHRSGAGEHEGRSMAKALEQQEQRQNDRITISTVHKAKGLEWPIVVVLDCTEGQMPIIGYDGRASMEEQRIFYVAVSRAMEQLVLFAQQGPDRQPSRYLTCLLEAGTDVATPFHSLDTA